MRPNSGKLTVGPNTKRKRSNYIYTLSAAQLAAFTELAYHTDQPIKQLVLTALDRYIKKELSQCRKSLK